MGNGRLGAMVFGGIRRERIALNEESLYSGASRPQGQPDIAGHLAEVRSLLASEKFEEADALVSRLWLGRGQECYQPLGDLEFEFENLEGISDYERSLDLANGIARIGFDSASGRHEREVFASVRGNAIVVRAKTSTVGKLSFNVGFRSPHPVQSVAPSADGEIHFSGQLPGLCLRRSWEWIEERADQWKYPEVYDESGRLREGAAPLLYGAAAGGAGMTFHCAVRAQLVGEGRLELRDAHLIISDATEVIIILAAASSYAGFDAPHGRDPMPVVTEALSELRGLPYSELRGMHETESRRLFNRVCLSLGGETPTEAETACWRGDSECALRLAETAFQFGRYLLIASSHPDSRHPANLQGIWNECVIPPWGSAYTTNINLEMNYWPALPANLSECNDALFRLVRECAENGRTTARKSYGLDGWVLHHNTDVWRKTDPVDFTARTAFWPMASGWLSCHLWEQFLFHGDSQFLMQTAYPLMRGACEFYLGWLVSRSDGWLTTPVSTSPENTFRAPHGGRASVSEGCTMDMSILRELFHATEKAARLAEDEPFAMRLAEARSKLRPFRIGRLGQLQEWAGDWDDPGDHHRHVSHLFGVFPGSQITSDKPELQQAALKSLEMRGNGGMGWSLVWKAALYARLGQPEQAWSCLQSLLQPAEKVVPSSGQISELDSLGGLYPNLMAAGPPFQIDANFGFVAAVCEMLLQSHEGFVNLLPALPSAWRTGSVTGLLARGGLEVCLQWHNGELRQANVRAKFGGEQRFAYGARHCCVGFQAGESRILTPGMFE